jgi:leucyl/phenylalanyl-tRNA--protein transferase
VSPELRWLDPAEPPDRFPDSRHALMDPDGLLAVGGDLSVERLLAAYRRGIFPWYQDDQPILWWTPDPRSVLFPREMHISRSLRRTLRRDRFTASVDRDFAAVIAACAADRDRHGTWITPDMQTAYCELHAHGHAHSVETWQDGALVGGIYGVNIGRAFFGESMFSRRSDASKVALARLVDLCRELAIGVIDCQLASAHLASLGARTLPREEFETLLRVLTSYPDPEPWPRDPARTSEFRVEAA